MASLQASELPVSADVSLHDVDVCITYIANTLEMSGIMLSVVSPPCLPLPSPPLALITGIHPMILVLTLTFPRYSRRTAPSHLPSPSWGSRHSDY